MFSKLSVKRPVTITMIILIVIVLGVVSLTKLHVDLLPNIELPIAIVQTTYSGAGPEEVENLVTRPLEQSLVTIENIDKVTSISNEGSSIVLLQFDYNTDMDESALQIREKVDMVKGYLPDGIGTPLVMKLDINSMPIIQMAISSEGDIHATQKIAEDVIQPRLERIEGTASANVSGGLEQEIEITLKEEALKGYNINSSYVTQILQAENLNLPGGTVMKGSNELTVRTVGEFKTIDEIKNLTVPLPSGGTLRLSDIADVKEKDKDKSSITKLDGKDVVQISVMKQSDGNIVDVSKKVNAEIEKIKEEYPNLDIVTVYDQADYINSSISNLVSTALQGAILAVIILFIFLRSFKTTLIIAVSIPISIITTFVILYFSNITLNMISIGGLALGIGMLVDNSIVVLENIYRNRSLGMDRISASINGANEVGTAVTASTLTTVAVFLPIVFTGGLAATIFKDLALTVVISLFSSLIVALTLIPMLSSKLITVKNQESEEEQEKKHGPVVMAYKKLLSFCLNHRLITIVASIALFIVSVLMLSSTGAELFPATDQGMLTVNVSLPDGSEVEKTDSILGEVEGLIKQIPEVETIFTSAGGGEMLSTGSDNSGTVMVILKDLKDRNRSAKVIGDEIRKLTKDVPGAEISVSEASMMSMGSGGISISISGDSLDKLKQIGDDFVDIIEQVDGTREVSSSYEDGIPQVQISVDRGIASQYGLTTAQIGTAVNNTLSGSDVTTFKVDGNELDVYLKGDNIYGESMSLLEQLPIPLATGGNVPLSEVANIKVKEGPVSITREDQTRIVTVSASAVGRDIQSVSEDIRSKLADYNMPNGYQYSFGGETEEMQSTFKDLFLVILIAILLVYMIIAAQFESLIQPFAIMCSIPLALSGGFIALYLTGLTLNVIGIIGIIVLVGIVVNNAIVLIDYINNRRKKGEDRKAAIMKAGPIRIRPIMMTALTTILGLVPMALGFKEGAELTRSMGVVIIGGLSLSTLLTLIVIPVMYTIFDDITVFFKRKLFKNTNETTEQI